MDGDDLTRLRRAFRPLELRPVDEADLGDEGAENDEEWVDGEDDEVDEEAITASNWRERYDSEFIAAGARCSRRCRENRDCRYRDRVREHRRM